MLGKITPHTEIYEDPLTGEAGIKRRCHVYANNEGDVTRLALQQSRSFDSMTNILLSEAITARKAVVARKKASKA